MEGSWGGAAQAGAVLQVQVSATWDVPQAGVGVGASAVQLGTSRRRGGVVATGVRARAWPRPHAAAAFRQRPWVLLHRGRAGAPPSRRTSARSGASTSCATTRRGRLCASAGTGWPCRWVCLAVTAPWRPCSRVSSSALHARPGSHPLPAVCLCAGRGQQAGGSVLGRSPQDVQQAAPHL